MFLAVNVALFVDFNTANFRPNFLNLAPLAVTVYTLLICITTWIWYILYQWCAYQCEYWLDKKWKNKLQPSKLILSLINLEMELILQMVEKMENSLVLVWWIYLKDCGAGWLLFWANANWYSLSSMPTARDWNEWVNKWMNGYRMINKLNEWGNIYYGQKEPNSCPNTSQCNPWYSRMTVSFGWKFLSAPPQMIFRLECETSASSVFEHQTLVVGATLPTWWKVEKSISRAVEICPTEYVQLLFICMLGTHTDTTCRSTMYMSQWLRKYNAGNYHGRWGCHNHNNGVAFKSRWRCFPFTLYELVLMYDWISKKMKVTSSVKIIPCGYSVDGRVRNVYVPSLFPSRIILNTFITDSMIWSPPCVSMMKLWHVVSQITAFILPRHSLQKKKQNKYIIKIKFWKMNLVRSWIIEPCQALTDGGPLGIKAKKIVKIEPC